MRQKVQAVVLAAGLGSRMTTIANIRPKFLLPIGNFPMVYYPLHFLQQAGFTEVSVIVSSRYENEMCDFVEQFGLNLSLDIIPVNTSDDPGTADSLRIIASKIQNTVDDVIILTSDLITDLSLKDLMDQHRAKGAALTMLTAHKDPHFYKGVPPGSKIKTNLGEDIICTEAKTKNLVYLVSAGDYDEDVTLPRHVAAAVNGSIEASAHTMDAHLYVLKRWVLDYVFAEDSVCTNMGSIKTEVIPHIISCQFNRNKDKGSKKVSSEMFMKSTRYEQFIKKYNTSNISSRFHQDNEIGSKVCTSYFHPALCVRVNTIESYWQINRKMHSLYQDLKFGPDFKLRHPTANIHERSQICSESCIGMSATVAEKTNIKSSTIGNHCRIDPIVRVSNSVLFDNVSLISGTVIEDSLVCVPIDKPCIIKKCIVTDASNIKENHTYTNEVIEASQEYTD